MPTKLRKNHFKSKNWVFTWTTDTRDKKNAAVDQK